MEKKNTKTTTKPRTRTKEKESLIHSEFAHILSFLNATVEKTRNAKEIFFMIVDNAAHRFASRIALHLTAYALVVFGIIFVFIGLADVIGMFFNIPGLGHMIIGAISLLSALVLFLVIRE